MSSSGYSVSYLKGTLGQAKAYIETNTKRPFIGSVQCHQGKELLCIPFLSEGV